MKKQYRGHNINPKVRRRFYKKEQVQALFGQWAQVYSYSTGQVGGGDCGIRPVSPVHGCF